MAYSCNITHCYCCGKRFKKNDVKWYDNFHWFCDDCYCYCEMDEPHKA